jgi:hypothetical protein
MTFPSELSPFTATSTSTSSPTIKREDGLSEPSSISSLTPPSSYVEFLKALTPVFETPVSAGPDFRRFNYERINFERKRRPSPISVPSNTTSEGPKTTSAAFQPLSPTTSQKSATSPQSARLPTTLRRLRIPTTCVYSPLSDSPGSVRTPGSARTPSSARTLHSPFGSSDWKIRYIETPRSAGGKSVSVRQVVTRTVTYKRTHLEPPPKGKRRKTADTRDE